MFIFALGCVKRFFICLLLAVGWGCMADSRVTEFTIFATADLHGAVLPLQRAVAPLVASARALDHDGVIYVDIGDTAQGSLLLQQKRGSGMMQSLSQAGCSIWVPGNHDLEFGFEAFKRMIFEFEGSVLAANLQAPELEEYVKSFKIVELNGVKVAFIGLMLPYMNNVFPLAEARFQTLPGKAVLRKAVDHARKAGTDMIVILRHAGKYGGGENLFDLTENMPEIDLVIGAHTHQAEAGERMRRFWYVQPPSHGRGVLKITISFDSEKHQIVQMDSQIIYLENSASITPEELDAMSVPAPEGGSDINFPAHKMRQYCQADLALYAVASQEDLVELMNKKSPTVGDYFRVFGYFDPVITVNVTAGEFREIVREYLAFALKRKQLLCVSNFEVKSSRGKLQDIIFSEPKNSYKLAISAYAASGAGGQLPGVRRILRDRIDHAQAESACGILDILTAPRR